MLISCLSFLLSKVMTSLQFYEHVVSSCPVTNHVTSHSPVIKSDISCRMFYPLADFGASPGRHESMWSHDLRSLMYLLQLAQGAFLSLSTSLLLLGCPCQSCVHWWEGAAVVVILNPVLDTMTTRMDIVITRIDILAIAQAAAPLLVGRLVHIW